MIGHRLFFFFLTRTIHVHRYIYLSIFWLPWVLVATHGLSLVVRAGGWWWLLSSCTAQASHCSGFSYRGAQALGIQASIIVA